MKRPEGSRRIRDARNAPLGPLNRPRHEYSNVATRTEYKVLARVRCLNCFEAILTEGKRRRSLFFAPFMLGRHYGIHIWRGRCSEHFPSMRKGMTDELNLSIGPSSGPHSSPSMTALELPHLPKLVAFDLE